MANTYHQIYIQSVFAVKYRKAMIDKGWRKDLMPVIGNVINEVGGKTMIINGVEDHVHCFFALKPSVSLSDAMRHAKAKSSKWVNDNGILGQRFEWQKGFGAFSYSRSHIDSVYRYIKDQEEHHKKQTFKEEYTKLLRLFDIEYDERYIFHEPI